MPSLSRSFSTWYRTFQIQRASHILEKAFKNEDQERGRAFLAGLLPDYVKGPDAEKNFQYFEHHGVHVTPVHYYSPVPELAAIDPQIWKRQSSLPGVDVREAEQLHFLNAIFPRFQAEYDQFPNTATGKPHEFYFENGAYSGTDALVLYCMVRHFQPRLVVEVGSGFSTRMIAHAAIKNGNTRLISVEPYPEPVLRQGFPGLDELVEKKVQDVDLELFEQLGPNDILFIDTTHIVKVGSDVNYLYLEVLPRLKPGVVVHIHDIFLPGDYPQSWVEKLRLFWNEQYLLHAFLIFNSGFEILFMNNYMGEKYPQEMRAVFPRSPWWGGGSFWMRRKPGEASPA